MRAIRAASAALLGVAAYTVTVPAAAAAEANQITPFGFTVTPSTVVAGGKVTLALTNCSTPATVSSGVFDTVTVPSGSSATATVDWDAKPGARYQVTFTCSGVSGTTNLTISRASQTPSARATVSAPSVASPGGVQGGLGGSIGGMSTAELVAGTALVIAAATGTVYAVRRRTENRGH